MPGDDIEAQLDNKCPELLASTAALQSYVRDSGKGHLLNRGLCRQLNTASPKSIDTFGGSWNGRTVLETICEEFSPAERCTSLVHDLVLGQESPVKSEYCWGDQYSTLIRLHVISRVEHSLSVLKNRKTHEEKLAKVVEKRRRKLSRLLASRVKDERAQDIVSNSRSIQSMLNERVSQIHLRIVKFEAIKSQLYSSIDLSTPAESPTISSSPTNTNFSSESESASPTPSESGLMKAFLDLANQASTQVSTVKFYHNLVNSDSTPNVDNNDDNNDDDNNNDNNDNNLSDIEIPTSAKSLESSSGCSGSVYSPTASTPTLNISCGVVDMELSSELSDEEYLIDSELLGEATGECSGPVVPTSNSEPAQTDEEELCGVVDAELSLQDSDQDNLRGIGMCYFDLDGHSTRALEGLASCSYDNNKESDAQEQKENVMPSNQGAINSVSHPGESSSAGFKRLKLEVPEKTSELVQRFCYDSDSGDQQHLPLVRTVDCNKLALNEVCSVNSLSDSSGSSHARSTISSLPTLDDGARCDATGVDEDDNFIDLTQFGCTKPSRLNDGVLAGAIDEEEVIDLSKGCEFV